MVDYNFIKNNLHVADVVRSDARPPVPATAAPPLCTKRPHVPVSRRTLDTSAAVTRAAVSR